MEYRIRENSLEDGSIPAWGEQAGALVPMAYDQMKRGKLDPAWKSLHASVRLSFLGWIRINSTIMPNGLGSKRIT